MTKFSCKDPSIIYSIIRANYSLILAASYYHIIFTDNVDLKNVIEKYKDIKEIKIEENYVWRKDIGK